MKEKIKNKIAEVEKLLSENHINADVEQFRDLPVICIDIRWGDWKHEHLRTNCLLKENVEGIEYFNTVVTEEDGSDCYSAQHRYIVID